MMQNNTYDIAVCGGGFAGISAALAAARQGRRVVLFEKEYMLGGLGTAGLVTIYLPLCDGLGRQVSFGIAEELLKLSITYGDEGMYPENWLENKGSRTQIDKRYLVQYNPQLFAILAEQLLLCEGVDIMYGSYVTDCTVKADRITSLTVHNKSGKTLYTVSSVVDATGDCDIAHLAGVPTQTFKQGNVLAAWYYFADESGYQLKQLGASDTPEEERNGKPAKTLIARRFTGLDGKELSEQTCLSHAQILKSFLEKREENKHVQLATIPTIPQIRMTRRIEGEYTLSYTEEHQYFEDSIGMVSNWKKRGPVWEVPFRILYNKAVKNLVTAGRCTSVNETLWDVMRVIPCCAVTGEAAGTAAALTDDFTTLSVPTLQDALRQKGVVLHENELHK